MTTINLIVLGMLKEEPMSICDIQKLAEYGSVSKWVEINTPSVYKKIIQLEGKGLTRNKIAKEGRMSEKTICSLAKVEESEFQRFVFETSSKPINVFLGFNAIVVDLDSLPYGKQHVCVAEIQENINTLKVHLEENIKEEEYGPSIPITGMAVLRQQCILAEVIQTWINSLGPV